MTELANLIFIAICVWYALAILALVLSTVVIVYIVYNIYKTRKELKTK